MVVQDPASQKPSQAQHLEGRQRQILERIARLEQQVCSLGVRADSSCSSTQLLAPTLRKGAAAPFGRRDELTHEMPENIQKLNGGGNKNEDLSFQDELNAGLKPTESEKVPQDGMEQDQPESKEKEKSKVDEQHNELATEEAIEATQQRLETICRSLGCASAQFKKVPHDYYDRSLEERRDLLGAASVEHLCKSIVMTNTQAPADITDCSNPRNSKYYVVVIQYVARLNAEKVKNFVYSLNDGKLPKKRINMRLAPSDVSDELTGYLHNSVTPFGMRTNIPVILSDAITKLSPPFFWLGAGEVLLKVGLEVSEFVDSIKPFIAECTY